MKTRPFAMGLMALMLSGLVCTAAQAGTHYHQYCGPEARKIQGPRYEDKEAVKKGTPASKLFVSETQKSVTDAQGLVLEYGLFISSIFTQQGKPCVVLAAGGLAWGLGRDLELVGRIKETAAFLEAQRSTLQTADRAAHGYGRNTEDVQEVRESEFSLDYLSLLDRLSLRKDLRRSFPRNPGKVIPEIPNEPDHQ